MKYSSRQEEVELEAEKPVEQPEEDKPEDQTESTEPEGSDINTT